MTSPSTQQPASTADGDWTPVALSDGLRVGEVRPAQAGSVGVALWRGDDGVAHAFDTRCPHRGMNLAYGFVRDNNLACAYHGWQYDEAGECVYIPAHPELPPARSICTRVYACTEHAGVVWVSATGSATDTLPACPVGEATGVRSVYVNAPASLVRRELALPDTQTWIALTVDERRLLCAVQDGDTNQCTLHVLLAQRDAVSAARLHAARWACDLRDRCEAMTGRQP